MGYIFASATISSMTEQHRPDTTGPPVTTFADIARLWDAIAPSYDQQIEDDEIQNNAITGQVLKSLHCDPRTVLDLACGTGLTVGEILRFLITEIGAVDISEQMLKQLRSKHPEDPRIVPVPASIDDYLTGCNETFDLITAVGIIPQLPHPGKVIEIGSNLLNPGGYMIFNFEPIILGKPDQDAAEYPFHNSRTGTTRIVHRQHPGEMLGLIQRNGLVPITRQRYSPVPMYPSQKVDIVASRKSKVNV